MSESRSAVAYRPLIRASVGSPGNGEDIANINTAPLPDGAECYVTENRSMYRLAKFSTLVASGTTIIAPNAGGGRWLLVGTVGGALSAFVYSSLGLSNDFFSDGLWVQATTANFAADVSPLWTFGASGCLLTYTGPAARELARLTAVVSRTDAPSSIYAGISLNNDVTGALAGSQGGPTGKVFVQESVADIAIQVATQRVMALTPGSLVQPRFGMPSGSLDTGVIYTLQLTVEAA
jgi:hypothetical protein